MVARRKESFYGTIRAQLGYIWTPKHQSGDTQAQAQQPEWSDLLVLFEHFFDLLCIDIENEKRAVAASHHGIAPVWTEGGSAVVGTHSQRVRHQSRFHRHRPQIYHFKLTVLCARQNITSVYQNTAAQTPTMASMKCCVIPLLASSDVTLPDSSNSLVDMSALLDLMSQKRILLSRWPLHKLLLSMATRSVQLEWQWNTLAHNFSFKSHTLMVLS